MEDTDVYMITDKGVDMVKEVGGPGGIIGGEYSGTVGDTEV